MLKNTKKFYFQPTLLFIILFSSVQVQAALIDVGASLFWNPDSTTQPVDQSFTLSLEGNSFIGGTSGGGVNVSWDNSIINLNSVAISDTFDDSAEFFSFNLIAPQVIDGNNIGSIFVAATSIIGTALTDFTVADFFFTAVNPGETNTTVVSLELLTDPWATFDLIDEHMVDISNATATVTVSAIPLPPAVLLFGSSLIGMFTFSRRRKYVSTT